LKSDSDKRERKHLRPVVTTILAFFPLGTQNEQTGYSSCWSQKQGLISEHSEHRTEVPTLIFIFGNGGLQTTEV